MCYSRARWALGWAQPPMTVAGVGRGSPWHTGRWPYHFVRNPHYGGSCGLHQAVRTFDHDMPTNNWSWPHLIEAVFHPFLEVFGSHPQGFGEAPMKTSSLCGMGSPPLAWSWESAWSPSRTRQWQEGMPPSVPGRPAGSGTFPEGAPLVGLELMLSHMNWSESAALKNWAAEPGIPGQSRG